ncbi:MAG: exodeoxyribonuclease VII small subunit [Zoogloeaceae bacterium]|jgi:exodeoxyribonuclease VII small subunit|nr:exodeoxyribonuclease VII small subunit [Zoogloeaceae bacterium]
MPKSKNSVVADTDAPELPADLKFEAALSELEALVARMEGGEMTLESSLAAYGRGMALVRHCQGQLAVAEEKMRVMDGADEGKET